MIRKRRGLLGLALTTGGVLSLFASRNPDGLDRVLKDLRIPIQPEMTLPAPFPDYAVPVINNPWFSGAVAGVVGTLLVLAVAWCSLSWLSSTGRHESTER